MKRLIKLIPPVAHQQLGQIEDKQRIISQALPKKMRPHVNVTGVDELVITLSVDGQHWSNNLRYHQQALLEALNANSNGKDWQLKIRNAQSAPRKAKDEEIEVSHSKRQTVERTRLRKLLNRL